MKRVLPLLLLFFLFGCSSKWDVSKRETPVYMGSGIFGTVAIKPKVKPLDEVKFSKVVRQKYDYSCGSAAVATILNYYIGKSMDELSVINLLFRVGNVEKIIKRKGFSLLDIKKFFEALGYRALGVRTDIEALAQANKPAIVTIVIGEYKHYVVFRGVHEGRVVVADPAFGTAVLPVQEFEKMWYKNIALLIDHVEIDKTPLALSEEELLIVKKEDIKNNLVDYILPPYRSEKDF